MPSRVSASPFINSNSGQEMLCCTLPPLPWARFEFEHKTNIQENLEEVLDLMDSTIIQTTKYIRAGIWSKQVGYSDHLSVFNIKHSM